MWHIFHGDDAGAAGLVEVGHLLQCTRSAVPDQIIRQQHSERLVTDDRLGAQHRVSQAQSLGLGDEDRAHAFRQHMADQFELLVLARALELLLQLVGLVEIVGDSVLVTVGDEHQGVTARFDRLIHGVLDQRPIDDRQHLLRHRLGCRKKTRAQTCYWKYRLANALAHWCLLASRAGKGTTLAEEM
ncbi:hypothetical protein D3C72_1622640 [compost metagenome]